MPGGANCTARVLVTDGFNTTSAISQPFAIPEKKPSATIFTEAITKGESINNPLRLEGFAYDLEDGIIPDENLIWTSDIDGELGVGSAIVATLSPGTHHITLQAQDSDINLSVAELSVKIQGESFFLGMKESSWLIIGITFVAILGVSALLLLWMLLQNRRKPVLAMGQRLPGRQSGAVQDNQGRWWHQDTASKVWSVWDGKTWQLIMGNAPQIVSPAKKSRVWGGCLLSLIISGGISLIVIGGISLIGLYFVPGYEIERGVGDLSQILKTGGGGLLLTIFALLLINGGAKSIITRRVIVEDDWGRRTEKRGFFSILKGLGNLLFGIILAAVGFGMMTVIFYQEILPWLGF